MSIAAGAERGRPAATNTLTVVIAAGDSDFDLSRFEEVERPGGAFTPHYEL